jgi:hypothetical protein
VPGTAWGIVNKPRQEPWLRSLHSGDRATVTSRLHSCGHCPNCFPYLLPCSSLSMVAITSGMLLKNKSHSVPLLNNFQWLPIAFWVNFKLLSRTWLDLHVQGLPSLCAQALSAPLALAPLPSPLSILISSLPWVSQLSSPYFLCQSNSHSVSRPSVKSFLDLSI